MNGQMKRLGAAAVIVGAVVIAPVAVHPADTWLGGADGAASQKPYGASAYGDGTVQALFDDIGGVDIAWGELPEGFAEDVFDPDSLGVREYAGARSCAGFVLDAEEDDAICRVEQALEGNGWCATEGEGARGLYRRERGRYAWAFVQGVPVASSTCVTVSLWEEEPL